MVKIIYESIKHTLKIQIPLLKKNYKGEEEVGGKALTVDFIEKNGLVNFSFDYNSCDKELTYVLEEVGKFLIDNKDEIKNKINY